MDFARGGFGRGAEGHAAAVNVGAADVDLDPADLGAGVDLFDALDILILGKAADVGDHRLVEALADLRNFLADDIVDARR